MLRKYEPGEDPSDIVVLLEEALREETLRVQERRRENDTPSGGVPDETRGDGSACVQNANTYPLSSR